MILLPQSIGVAGRRYNNMRVVPNFCIGVGQKGCVQPFITNGPVLTAIGCFKYTGAADANMNMIFIAGINNNRMNTGQIAATAKTAFFAGTVIP